MRVVYRTIFSELELIQNYNKQLQRITILKYNTKNKVTLNFMYASRS